MLYNLAPAGVDVRSISPPGEQLLRNHKDIGDFQDFYSI